MIPIIAIAGLIWGGNKAKKIMQMSSKSTSECSIGGSYSNITDSYGTGEVLLCRKYLGHTFYHYAIYIKLDSGVHWKLHFGEKSRGGTCEKFNGIGDYTVYSRFGDHSLDDIKEVFGKMKSSLRSYNSQEYNCYHWCNEFIQSLTGTYNYISIPKIPLIKKALDKLKSF